MEGETSRRMAEVSDIHWMRRALSLARRALGRTSPNPAVGAVIVRDGEAVGWGATHPPGGPHAEAVALAKAGKRAEGATLYVTLEPCAHYGRTPPCCESIISAGIARVVCAVEDPNPLVSGRGIASLRRSGVKVDVGLLKAEAERLNEWYLHYVTTGRPFVTCKYAMSLDGKTATRTGESRWITGEAARRYVHRLRRTHDAVMCGIGTALKDDPLLTPRPRGRTRRGYPLRIVVDSQARLPVTAAMLKDTVVSPVLVACTEGAPADRVDALCRAGAEVVRLPSNNGRVDLDALLSELGARGITSVLLEGGGELAEGFVRQGLVNKVLAFVAPVVIGGRAAPTPVGGEGSGRLADALRLGSVRVRRFGADIGIEGYVTAKAASDAE
ncbi:MAG: bifunctional diaminohydroxyphosphoribosylaminopyrimidine deaminase/5-amino-6-(5-phosphoribosylamino)uracil reductase RibD [Armatimonadota bacterium]